MLIVRDRNLLYISASRLILGVVVRDGNVLNDGGRRDLGLRHKWQRNANNTGKEDRY